MNLYEQARGKKILARIVLATLAMIIALSIMISSVKSPTKNLDSNEISLVPGPFTPEKGWFVIIPTTNDSQEELNALSAYAKQVSLTPLKVYKIDHSSSSLKKTLWLGYYGPIESKEKAERLVIKARNINSTKFFPSASEVRRVEGK